MAYDIIGDIHGQASKLQALLDKLGYKLVDGIHVHPDSRRQAIFVGDLIDRGPEQVATVSIVQNMVKQGSALAIMGNHEFNAIAWHTPHPAVPGDFLRTRLGELGQKNRAQHSAFLSEVETDEALHASLIDWFLTLPLWADLPGIRVVHACWHDDYMARLAPFLSPGQRLNRELMVQAITPGSMEFQTIEGLTKGIEAALPAGHHFADEDGHARSRVRLRWWDDRSTTYRDLALMPDPLRQRLPDEPLVHDDRPRLNSGKLTFFGHYWMTGTPMAQNPTMACVDYSAAKGGELVAYFWDGEAQIDARHFVSVP